MNNSNNGKFKKQFTTEREEIIVKIVTMDVKKIEDLKDLLT